MNQRSLFLYQTQKVGYSLAGLFCMFSIYALDVQYELLYSMSSLDIKKKKKKKKSGDFSWKFKDYFPTSLENYNQ